MGEVCSSPRGPQLCQLPKDPQSCLHKHCNATLPVIPPVLWDPLKDFIHGLLGCFFLGSPQKRNPVGFPWGQKALGCSESAHQKMTMQKEGNPRHTGVQRGHFILLGGQTGLGHLWPEHCPCPQPDTANVCVSDLEGQQCHLKPEPAVLQRSP